jgi:hypothetical protein
LLLSVEGLLTELKLGVDRPFLAAGGGLAAEIASVRDELFHGTILA